MTYLYHADDVPFTHEEEVAAWEAQLAGPPRPGPDHKVVPKRPDPTPENIEFQPAQWRRFDGWTAERQRIFIRALAETACVSDACDQAGCTPRSAYRLRLRPGAEAFAAAWAQAQALGAQRLTTLAFERAIHGTRRAVFFKGQYVADHLVPSDRLLMFLLKHYDRSGLPGVATPPGFTAVPDPVPAGRAALPALLDSLVDQRTAPDADEHESFDFTPMPETD